MIKTSQYEQIGNLVISETVSKTFSAVGEINITKQGYIPLYAYVLGEWTTIQIHIAYNENYWIGESDSYREVAKDVTIWYLKKLS